MDIPGGKGIAAAGAVDKLGRKAVRAEDATFSCDNHSLAAAGDDHGLSARFAEGAGLVFGIAPLGQRPCFVFVGQKDVCVRQDGLEQWPAGPPLGNDDIEKRLDANRASGLEQGCDLLRYGSVAQTETADVD